ncbi:MAG: DEAD/DEAH box helicase [Candidatus Omnitrophota bacterium]|nr:MAG: DEAD/DEAH box helicase [Candidatus Omnitrophota bacterium]
MLEKFKVLGLSKNTLAALQQKGFEEPTKIQEQVIPLLLQDDVDVVGHAQTGTGKTAAFGLPLIERLQENRRKPQALILAPTRELAVQVAEEINSLRGKKHLEIAAIYGGQSMDQQLRRLRRGVDIVVGTPGRVKDHLQRRSLDISQASYAVLDEADEMLNMGFIEDVEDILSYAFNRKRTLLFSATMPERILLLAKKHMGSYKLVRAQKEQLTVSLTDQIYFEVAHSDKLEALCRIIDSEVQFYGLIFCRTKIDVDEVSKKLCDRGYDAEGLHGDISQYQRERTLKKFKERRINVLVATDVAARGIDIISLSHVINYSLPQNPESYVHRIGRTGRAGKEGTAITFVTPAEYRKLIAIKRFTKTDIRKEKIPAVEEVIRSKKTRIKNDIVDILQSSEGSQYLDFAQEMLSENDPEKVLAALIKYAFQNELSARSYSKIRDVSVDTKGTTRLFVARGRADEMDPRKIVDMIRNIAQVDPRKIRDVRVFDKFSFVTAPFEEAETILRAFKERKMSKRPIVERAKEKKRR